MMNARKIAYLGLFMALALVLSYVESLIPFYVGIPGVKIGFTNIITVLMLYMSGPVEALFIAVGRVIISGFLFGNAFSIIYSLAGCMLSFCFMYAAKKMTKLKIISVSLLGGITHNVGQLVIAVIVMSKEVLYYFPVLMLAGAITGLLIGIVSTEIFCRVESKFNF